MWSTTMACRRFINLYILLLFVGCSSPEELLQIHRGQALGTTYIIQYQGNALRYAQNQKTIDSLFEVINQSLSTYRPDSDISKINNGEENVVVDSHFKSVFHKATQVWQASDGFFDPTVGSLANAYGFGPQRPLSILGASQRDSLLALTGWDKINLTQDHRIEKKSKGIQMDFNAIAKGYMVDVIGSHLTQVGYVNFLIEIGGELLASGSNPKTMQAWKVAIDDPQQGIERTLKTVLPLKNEALATSGNYRKFRIDSLTGVKYVHSLNPHTGLPVQSKILSASVRAPNCMTADAYATTLMVLPLEKGQALIAQDPELAAYWVLAQASDTTVIQSKNW